MSNSWTRFFFSFLASSFTTYYWCWCKSLVWTIWPLVYIGIKSRSLLVWGKTSLIVFRTYTSFLIGRAETFLDIVTYFIIGFLRKGQTSFHRFVYFAFNSIPCFAFGICFTKLVSLSSCNNHSDRRCSSNWRQEISLTIKVNWLLVFHIWGSL